MNNPKKGKGKKPRVTRMTNTTDPYPAQIKQDITFEQHLSREL